MRLRTLLELSMFESNDFDGAGQDDLAQGRAIPQFGYFLSNRLIQDSGRAALENDVLHCLRSSKILERPHRKRDRERRGLPSFPDNTRLDPITCQAMYHHLVDQCT